MEKNNPKSQDFKTPIEALKDPIIVESFKDSKRITVQRYTAIAKELRLICDLQSKFETGDLARLVFDLSKMLLDLRPQLDVNSAYDEVLGLIASEDI